MSKSNLKQMDEFQTEDYASVNKKKVDAQSIIDSETRVNLMNEIYEEDNFFRSNKTMNSSSVSSTPRKARLKTN